MRLFGLFLGPVRDPHGGLGLVFPNPFDSAFVFSEGAEFRCGNASVIAFLSFRRSGTEIFSREFCLMIVFFCLLVITINSNLCLYPMQVICSQSLELVPYLPTLSPHIQECRDVILKSEKSLLPAVCSLPKTESICLLDSLFFKSLCVI